MSKRIITSFREVRKPQIFETQSFPSVFAVFRRSASDIKIFLSYQEISHNFTCDITSFFPACKVAGHWKKGKYRGTALSI
jgi:hypothetical protein